MLSRAQLFLLSLSCLLAWPAIADLAAERQLFLDAEKAINKKDWRGWNKLKPRLRQYPLYTDLLYKIALKDIGKAKPAEVRTTLQVLKDTPLYNSYLKSWLRRLAQKKSWQSYIDFYQPKLGARYRCYYASALYHTGQAITAFPVVKKLWLTGTSRPDYCDDAFEQFKNSGQLSSQLVWQRIELAMAKGSTSLVRYLQKLLPRKQQFLVNEWLAIRNKPDRSLQSKYILSNNPHRKNMVVYGIRRMALFDADKALAAWEKQKPRSRLDAETIREIDRYIALRLTTQRLPGAVTQYQKLQLGNQDADRKSLQWAARAAIRERDWAALNRFIRKMGDLDSLDDRWKYWQAKSHQQLGNTIEAEAIFQILALRRGYHNFLAADELSLPYRLDHQPLSYKADALAALKKNNNVRRAYEYFILDRIAEARREWYYLLKQYGDADRQKLAYIAKQWGWHSQAILTIARTDHRDDLDMRFPVVFEKQVRKATKRNGLDLSWVMALIRQESAFQADARSSAGARGLMQLMPATSRHVAKILNHRRPKLFELYQPALNIRLGTQYLKTNMKKFNNHLVLTTAAYNAGPHRVTKWLPKNASMDAASWAESIPFKETRNYVQRIFSYAAIYDQKLGQKIRRVGDRMQPVQP